MYPRSYGFTWRSSRGACDGTICRFRWSFRRSCESLGNGPNHVLQLRTYEQKWKTDVEAPWRPWIHTSVGQTIQKTSSLILKMKACVWSRNLSVSSLSPVVPLWTPSLRRRFLWTVTRRTDPAPSSACLHHPAPRLKVTIQPAPLTTPRPASFGCLLSR